MSKEKSKCARCSGDRKITCPGCGGSGKSEQLNEGKREGFSKIVSCAGCNGRGTRTCGSCNGSGEK
jgi:DnaJ-class molecular chaperone